MQGWKAKLRNLDRPADDEVEKSLRAVVGDRLKIDQPTSVYTSLRVGGVAKFFAEVDSDIELSGTIAALNQTGRNYED